MTSIYTHMPYSLADIGFALLVGLIAIYIIYKTDKK